MTNEEAIQRLKDGEPFDGIFDLEWDIALDMAITALSVPEREKGECSKCIHSAERDGEFCYECVKGNEDNFVSAEGEYIKKEDLFAKTIDKNKAWLYTTNAEGKNLKEIVEDLPTYSFPEREKGEWIEKEGYDGDTYYDCSACGNSWTTIEGTPWESGMDFCPNCGADMRGGKE